MAQTAMLCPSPAPRPQVRLKKFLEMRGADCGPLPMIIALPALWTGLLYDRQAQAECAALIADWTQVSVLLLLSLLLQVPNTALTPSPHDYEHEDGSERTHHVFPTSHC